MTVEAHQVRTVRFDAPVSVGLTLAMLRRGPGDPTVVRDSARLWLTSRMPTGPVTLLLRQVDARTVTADAWGLGAEERLASLPRMLGEDDDPGEFRPTHPAVADAHRRFPGLRVPSTGRVMEALVAAVIEQKVLGVDAFASWRRLVRAHGDPAPGPAPARMRVFPTPERWAAVPSWEWHLAGVDPKRARTVQACARLGHQLERVAGHDDLADTYRALRSIPGVGVWTAAEVGSRALGDADAVSFGDYHLGHLVGVGLVGEKLEDDADIVAALEPYRPQRFRAVRLLALSPHVRLERRGPRLSRSDHHTR